MPALHCPADDTAIILIDIQANFMAAIHEADRVRRRSKFLLNSAKVLGIPIIATEQYPSRMGSLEGEFASIPSHGTFPKMAFSCWGAGGFQEAVESLGRSCVVLVGIETHICVTLTALDLMNQGFNVFVCPDAVSARSLEMHKLGMERMRDSGAVASHTETLVYEWMGSAEHPKFREVLEIVKASVS